ncbi:Receptor-type tyrosine-protein phosphatase kappa [Holothuria leucospilota]|uniref:Receptor-type tyrosine-protein phosphatase kappa n=1 Tax=Holothuria leucospilota TaxID=206669 RepID=A0A9Q1H202_HOLLE|nr:Receptor-type tyrosine-protein phosphatase kappa [Holothuria leucospilota]
MWGKPWCLDDIPDDKVREVSINEVNPAPSITHQCTEMMKKISEYPEFYQSVTGCVEETTCTSLVCELPDRNKWYVNVCTPMGIPPAEGTSCGYYRYCINGKCVPNVKDVSSLDMSDGEFSEWETSPCSQSCGGGVKVTRRTCSNPPQEFAGAFCDGQHLHYELCNLQPCPGGKTFLEKRDDSCSSISPDLGFYIFSEDGAPPTCLKACVNHTSFEWSYFEPLYFEDGTKCWDDIFNDDFTLEKRCVAGKCVQFNCFGDEGFKGLYDECRVCGGKGTSCSPRNETIFNDKHQRNIILPVGATSVLVSNYDCQTEQGRTALDLKSGGNVLVNGGNVFKVGFAFPNGIRCAVNLTSTGPLKAELSLSSEYRSEIRANHRLLSVSYFEPKSSPTFLWRPGPFGLCSADCGAGIRRREIRCLEIRNGQEREVADNMCNILDKPRTTVPCCIPCWSFTFTPCKDDENGYVYTRVRRAECKIGNKVVDSSKCNPATKPVNVYMPCSGDRQWLKYKWTVGPWSSCYGCRRTRDIACVVGPHEFPVSDNLCNTVERPNQSEQCPTPSCGGFTTPSSRTTYSWHTKSWSLCRSCDKRYRSVECVDDVTGGVVSDEMCYSPQRPDDSETCSDDPSCSYEGYHWSTGPWSPCTMCRRTREVECFDAQSGKGVCLEMCDPKLRPDEIGDCEDCADWISEAWSECSVSCGTGFQTRHVSCSSPENVRCYINKPPETKPCDLRQCYGRSAEPPSLSPGLIVMAVFGVVVLPFVLWGIVRYLRRKIKKMQTLGNSRLRDDNIAIAESVNCGDISTTSSGSVMALPTFRDSDGIFLPIQIKDLPKCFQKSRVNPEETLVDEFMKLSQPHGLTISEGETKRNQESTELHQDEMITQVENRSPCYIKSKGKVVLIVTEGPIPSTLKSFWKLIWQEKSPIIVNLTERKDITMTNSPSPTTDQVRRYGELISLGTTKRAEYSVESVKVVKGSEIRHVTICHFFLWPETGVPEQPEGLIGFIKKLRSLYQGHSAPILVHCNNDLRSSSAFVTIFCLVEHLTTRQPINVNDFLGNLRDIDKDLTPNQDQYNFIYEALAAASLFPQVDLQPHTLLSMDLNNNNILGKLIREYEAILNQQMFGTPAVSAEGCKPHNAAKNRYPDIVPLDRYRPVWTFSDNANASSYINATLVDSFWSYNGIITTQSPLPNTIEDFWSTIYYYKCSAVVSLNSFTKRNENVPQYWLDGFTAKYGKYIVECAPLSHWRSGVFIKRKMFIRREGSSTRLNIDHYQLLNWSTPNNNLSGLLDIIAAIQPMLKAKKRIALHCMDGAGRSGIIAAVSTELGRVKEDGMVDLFQTVVKLRRRNPRFIKCQEEYIFSYTLLQAALKAWRAEF